MNHHEIVKRLIGKINPIGESNTDAERFENLKEMCHLVEMLLMDISDMQHAYKNDRQASVKKCVDYAAKFMITTVKDLSTPSGSAIDASHLKIKENGTD